MKKGLTKLSFKEAVALTPDVATNYCCGIDAFGEYRSKIKVPDTTKINGSLDIDESTKKIYPNDNRWDYAICYNEEVFYIEVHSAITSEVTRMINKLKWLKNWLVSQAPEINKLTTKTKEPFYWVQSSNSNIPKHTCCYSAANFHKCLKN